MAYAIYHHYTYDKGKHGSVLIALRETLAEAEALVLSLYDGRFVSGKEQVGIHDSSGNIIKSWEVDYMAQFEAVPGKVWQFASSSGSGIYKTQVNTTGILSCNCKGWTIKKKGQPRHCKHTDEVRATQHMRIEERGQYLYVVDEKIANAAQKFAPGVSKSTQAQLKFAALVRDYEEAINLMTSLDPDKMYQAAAAVEQAKFKCEAYLLLLEQHGIDGGPQFQQAEAKLQQALGAH